MFTYSKYICITVTFTVQLLISINCLTRALMKK